MTITEVGGRFHILKNEDRDLFKELKIEIYLRNPVWEVTILLCVHKLLKQISI